MNFGADAFGNRTFDWSGPIQRGSPFEDYLRSADNRSIVANTRRSELAHNALMRAQAANAESDNQLLSTASDAELAFIAANPPQTERQARLLRIIQGDINARERGVALMPTWKQIQDYEHGILANRGLATDLQTKAMNLQMAPAKFALDIQEFENQKKNQSAAQQMEREKFGFTKETTAAEQAFRNAELAARDRQFNRGLQNDSMRQFSDVLKSVRAGELSADDVIAAFPTLTAGQVTLLRGHEQAAQQNAGLAQRQADALNNELRASIPQPVTPSPGIWDRIRGVTPAAVPPSEEEIAAAQAAIRQRAERNPQYRAQVYFDPETGMFAPRVRGPGGASSSGNSGAPYDPVPVWLRNQMTGTMPDVSSGPMPDASHYNPAAIAAPFVPGPVMDGGMPTQLRDGDYRAPDGSRFRVMNGRRYRI